MGADNSKTKRARDEPFFFFFFFFFSNLKEWWNEAKSNGWLSQQQSVMICCGSYPVGIQPIFNNKSTVMQRKAQDLVNVGIWAVFAGGSKMAHITYLFFFFFFFFLKGSLVQLLQKKKEEVNNGILWQFSLRQFACNWLRFHFNKSRTLNLNYK